MPKSINTEVINRVGNWLKDEKNAGSVSGISFSMLHALIFSASPSDTVQYLGYASFALNASILSIRHFLPSLNASLTNVFNKALENVKMPSFESAGFPLFLNGLVLTGIATTAFINNDPLSGAISLAYAIANTDKGARISQNIAWTMENLVQSIFNKAAKHLPYGNTQMGAKMLSNNSPRFLKHSLYLPELWGSLGATIYGASHSGWAAAVGALSATVAVTAAAINNGDLKNPAVSQAPIINRITNFFDRNEDFKSSDAVVSRRFMKYASLSFAAGAGLLGNVVPAIAHSFATLGNHTLERADRSRQLAALSTEQPSPT